MLKRTKLKLYLQNDEFQTFYLACNLPIYFQVSRGIENIKSLGSNHV